MPPTRTSSERTNCYDPRAAGHLELPMAKKVVPHTKPRFDINASLSKDGPLVVIFFTAAELAKFEAGKILGNLPCTKCCLDVATWGFGAYIYDPKSETIESSVSVCKACYVYEPANPQKDEEEELIVHMRTDRQEIEEIPSGRPNVPVPMAPRRARSLSQIVNFIKVFPAMVPAPLGVRQMHRPAKRQELCEHVEAIMAHYDEAVSRAEHRWTFASANWDSRDRLDRLDRRDEFDLVDRKRKWNAYETARLAVQSAEAAVDGAYELVNELGTLAHSAPVDSLREKVVRFITSFKVVPGCKCRACSAVANGDSGVHSQGRMGWGITEHNAGFGNEKNNAALNALKMPPAVTTMFAPASSALAARMAESLMGSGLGTVSNLEKRDAHEQEREALYERVCLARQMRIAATRSNLFFWEYNRRFGVSYWIAEMQTARVSDGLPVPRASSPVPPRTMAAPTTAEEQQAQEPTCKAFNLRVCEAKALTDEDRFNEVNGRAYQALAEEYAHAFGVFVPDHEIDEYLILKRKESLLMDVRREVAIKEGCPFENPQPLERYITGAHEFYERLSQAYKNNADGQEDMLNQKCELLGVYQKLLRRCWNIEEEWKLVVGQETQSFTFVNPFPAGDIRRAALNGTLQERLVAYNGHAPVPRLPRRSIMTIRTYNRHFADPGSIKCRRQYCLFEILREEVEALERQAFTEMKASPPPLPL
ncbi:hypothetical protein C8R45DRAFT_1103459 [Mycena sanguinolenta]|nr:hypothetical protein C8R45DRAFT_1103459 [Mycena sanguinolenta]